MKYSRISSQRELSQFISMNLHQFNEEHRRMTHLVLDRMRKHKLYLQPEKCEFEKAQIEYLGVIISHNKAEMDSVKVAGVADWPTPMNKKELQSFVGFINFYCRFIPGFSHHACALFDPTLGSSGAYPRKTPS
jgi:hypothetical protein